MKRLNLGCGSRQMAGWVNVDCAEIPGVDVVHDLDVIPWPWGDASITEISGFDIFEHVNNPIGFMNQCGRILRPGGILNLHTNYWKSENAFTDPTHKRFCTEKSFDYWCQGTEFNERYGAAYAAPGVLFEKVKVYLDGTELVAILRRI